LLWPKAGLATHRFCDQATNIRIILDHQNRCHGRSRTNSRYHWVPANIGLDLILSLALQLGVSALDDARRILEGAEWLAPDALKLAPLLVNHGKLARRPTGAWVYSEGDENTGLLIVVGGALYLFCHGLGEQRVRVGLVGPGAALGQSVRFGGGPRLVTASAATPCEILAVSDTALSRVAEQSPEIWRAVAKLLYGQLRYALRFGADMLTLPPTQRVAARLSDIAEVTARLDALPLSQQALGEMTGLTRKTINAVLRRLQADGVLACDYRRIEIRDVDRLRVLLAFRRDSIRKKERPPALPQAAQVQGGTPNEGSDNGLGGVRYRITLPKTIAISGSIELRETSAIQRGSRNYT